MNGCKYIKERIDEAEKPDLLPFEVTEHIGQCDDCERFAIERTALRELVAAGTRVSAPINFDAMLKARLAEVKARRSFWWLGSPGFLRLGAATAGLVVMIFAAQYAGLFSNNATRVADPRAGISAPRTDEPSQALSQAPPVIIPRPSQEDAVVYANVGQTLRGRRSDIPVGRVATRNYMTAEDGGVVLVRGRNGEMDVQMPTVSVGAQPLMYVSAGQRTVRNVGTSF